MEVCGGAELHAAHDWWAFGRKSRLHETSRTPSIVLSLSQCSFLPPPMLSLPVPSLRISRTSTTRPFSPSVRQVRQVLADVHHEDDAHTRRRKVAPAPHPRGSPSAKNGGEVGDAGARFAIAGFNSEADGAARNLPRLATIAVAPSSADHHSSAKRRPRPFCGQKSSWFRRTFQPRNWGAWHGNPSGGWSGRGCQGWRRKRYHRW